MDEGYLLTIPASTSCRCPQSEHIIFFLSADLFWQFQQADEQLDANGRTCGSRNSLFFAIPFLPIGA